MVGCPTPFGVAGIRGAQQRFVGGDAGFDRGTRHRTHRGDQVGKPGVDGPRRCLGDDVGAEFGALIDPGAQNADVVGVKCARWRHLQAPVAVDQPPDEFAVRAFARDDHGAVVAAAQCVLAKVQT